MIVINYHLKKSLAFALLFVGLWACTASAQWQQIRTGVEDVILAYDQIDNLTKVFAVDAQTKDIFQFDGFRNWSKVGGPGFQFVAGKTTAGTALYGLSPNKSAVMHYQGKQVWRPAGGPAEKLYGGIGGIYAISPANGHAHSYDPFNQKWTEVGGPGRMIAVGGEGELYAISPNGNGLYRYSGTPGNWQRIWNQTGQIYAAPGCLFATDGKGDIYQYNGQPFSWTRVGGPGKMFAATAGGGLYGISPNGGGIYQYLGRPDQWQRVGAASQAIYAQNDDLYSLRDDGSLWQLKSQAVADTQPKPVVKKIDKWQLIPVFNYTYWCVPTSMAMILGFYDNYDSSIGTIAGYGRLIKYWLNHPENHPNGSNAPSLIDEIIDPKTKKWRIPANGKGWGTDHNARVRALFGYDFDFIDHEASSCQDWCWEEIKQEVDAGRPFFWNTPGHTVTGYGYRINQDGTKQVLVHNAPNTTTATFTEFCDYSTSTGMTRVIPKGGGNLSNLAMLAPDGGETWKSNEINEIKWQTWGTQISRVNIEVSSDGGQTWSPLATSVAARSGENSYKWSGSLTTAQARIRISGFDGTGKVLASDGSQSNFSVVK